MMLFREGVWKNTCRREATEAGFSGGRSQASRQVRQRPQSTPWELWSWDDPAELSKAKVREAQAFTLPHWSVIGIESTLEGGTALGETVFFQSRQLSKEG